MTVMALLKKSGEELEKWYITTMSELAIAEAKARDANKYDKEHWFGTYDAYWKQFKSAVDLKFKLEVIKFLEIQSSNQTVREET